MDLHVYNEPGEVIAGMADFFVQTINKAIADKGSCNLVLSGGNSPKQLYRLLASAAYDKSVNWNRVFFFFGDERYVPFDDENNNGQMAGKFLFDPLQIEKSNIFYINTALPPEEAATDYTHCINKHFNHQQVQFDLILLGLGDNAHTASLFPFTEVLHEMKPVVCAPFIEELSAYRITMTAPLINQAHTIAFLVYGDSKAKAVYNSLEATKDADHYPAQLINSKEGTTHWFLDRKAASLLNNVIHFK